MPPKKSVADEKTFGMKNKKSAKVQKFVQNLEQQAKNGGKQANKYQPTVQEVQAKKKKDEEDRKKELAELFKTQQQKVPFGVDPKTVLCSFFKQGTCTKGSKCKFSHDLAADRKNAKIDVYTDARAEQEMDTMDKWDEAKLASVIATKQGNSNLPTEIVCKYFIDAIEARKYGWFWDCPNGNDKCKYRHALPPGFVLKKKETDEERREREEREKENELTIEDFLETERHKLGPNLTPITYESFQKWKETRKARLQAEEENVLKKRLEAFKQMKSGGKSGIQFSGRELFDFNPDLALGGDDDDAMDEYERADSEHSDNEDYQGAPQYGEDDEEEDNGEITYEEDQDDFSALNDAVVVENLEDEQ